MHVPVPLALLAATLLAGCNRPEPARVAAVTVAAHDTQPARATSFAGFDRNDYPGDDRLVDLHRHFSFAGFWLTPPPGATTNSWAGKRGHLLDAGFGFLVLANGRLDAELRKSGTKPADLGRADAAAAIAGAKREGFPDGTLVFLDQEEGGRLLPEQAAYFFGWTEALAASTYRPGAYVSGQSTGDGTGPDGKPLLVTTAQDVREHVDAEHLHPITLWVAQDTCPPAPGCTAAPPSIHSSGTMDAPVWQYAQSPRRPELTRACAKTYAPDGNCYAGISRDLFLDLDVADSADPSHGR